MIKMKNILFDFFKAPCACLALVGVLVSAPVVAATDNGCDDENNDYIMPELALCSVHAYNINHVKNPSDEATRQAMKEIVALKTTLMTQQMYKQYEYLDAMLRRFKTQLKKAVLTTSLQAVGAAVEEASTTASKDSKVVLAGTQNCMISASTPVDAAKCLQQNTQNVINALNAGNTRDAKKQLAEDIDVAETWGIISATDEKKKTVYNDLSACKNKTSTKDVLGCAQKFLVAIGTWSYDTQNAQKSRTMGFGLGG